MRPYFAYGSNMSQSRLQERVGQVRVLGRARLCAHRHRFSKLGRDGTGKGNIEACAGASVWGVLYELDHAQLAQLDDYELGYRGLELELELDDRRSVLACSYAALKIVPTLTPTRAYLRHYLTGMREHAIPPDYRDEILSSSGLAVSEHLLL